MDRHTDRGTSVAVGCILHSVGIDDSIGITAEQAAMVWACAVKIR